MVTSQVVEKYEYRRFEQRKEIPLGIQRPKA
jgi:hypothetical protein